ncbi:MAG: hypothetical protein NWE89_07800 [Candidatus Bathyarchaeota archaeon]|nr:hypothetical protein [Candidatus Bathyarchaeota archaeon]
MDDLGDGKPMLLGMVLIIFAIPFIYDADFMRLIFFTPVIGLINILF